MKLLGFFTYSESEDFLRIFFGSDMSIPTVKIHRNKMKTRPISIELEVEKDSPVLKMITDISDKVFAPV